MRQENVIIIRGGGQDYYIETFFSTVKKDGEFIKENPDDPYPYKVLARGAIMEVKTYIPFKNTFIEVKIPAAAIVAIAEEINAHRAKTEFIIWED